MAKEHNQQINKKPTIKYFVGVGNLYSPPSPVQFEKSINWLFFKWANTGLFSFLLVFSRYYHFEFEPKSSEKKAHVVTTWPPHSFIPKNHSKAESRRTFCFFRQQQFLIIIPQMLYITSTTTTSAAWPASLSLPKLGLLASLVTLGLRLWPEGRFG